MMAVLELRDVSRVFDGATSTRALRSVNLSVASGEFVAIVGPSGAGKSTLLNLLGLLDQPSTGTYLIDGNDTSKLSRSKREVLRSEIFGFVFQDSHIIGSDTVGRNAALTLRLKGVPRAEQQMLVAAALERLGLTSRVAAEARSLSGGERQRLAVGRALVHRPSVLLADEPTGNLDSANSQIIIGILRQLRDDGVTIVVVTHDHRVAAAADRRIEIEDGFVAEAVDPGEVSRQIRPLPEPRVGSLGRRLKETLFDAINSLTNLGARTALLMLAFLLATAGLVSATGLNSSAQLQISDRIAQAGLDQVRVFLPPLSSQDELQEAVDRISKLPGVLAVSPWTEIGEADARVTILQGEGLGDFSGSVIATDSAGVESFGAEIWPTSVVGLFDSMPSIAVITPDAAASLEIGHQPVGSQLWIAGELHTVVGEVIPSEKEQRAAILIPAAPSAAVLEMSSSLRIRTLPGYPAPLASKIPVAINPGNPASISVEAVGDIRTLQTGVGNDLSVLLAVVSAILLAVVSLSAGTSLYLSVQARKQEIALRRAVGAKRAQIVLLFLWEGSGIGLAGGLAGAALGIGIVVAACVVRGWVPVVSPTLMLAGGVVGLVCGALASLLPALSASRIDPALALKA